MHLIESEHFLFQTKIEKYSITYTNATTRKVATKNEINALFILIKMSLFCECQTIFKK